jgi:DNA-binding NarL/FixJ family response regulator
MELTMPCLAAGAEGFLIMKRLRVLLVEDHGLVRAGFRALLDGISGVQVVGEAADGRSGLNMIGLKKPHVVLMDIALPKLNGLEVLERVVRDYPKVQVVMLSMHANEEYVSRALRSGARGYVLKDADISELELALRAVAEGNVYLSPAVSKSMVDDYMRRVRSQGSPHALTERQQEVLKQVAEGKNTKEIAYRLKLSVKTIESHRAQLMKRLDIHDVAGLVRYAIRAGLVRPEE